MVPSPTTFHAMEFRRSFDLSPYQEDGTSEGSQNPTWETFPGHLCPQKRYQLSRVIRPSLENLLNGYSVDQDSNPGSPSCRANVASSLSGPRNFHTDGSDVSFADSGGTTLMKNSLRQRIEMPKAGDRHAGSEREDSLWQETAGWSNGGSSGSTCQFQVSTCESFEDRNRDYSRSSATASELMCRVPQVQELRSREDYNGKPSLRLNLYIPPGESENVGRGKRNTQPQLRIGQELKASQALGEYHTASPF